MRALVPIGLAPDLVQLLQFVWRQLLLQQLRQLCAQYRNHVFAVRDLVPVGVRRAVLQLLELVWRQLLLQQLRQLQEDLSE